MLKKKTKTHCFPSLKYILRKRGEKRKKKPNMLCNAGSRTKSCAIKVLLSHGGTLSMNQIQTQLQLNSKSDKGTTQPFFLLLKLVASVRPIPEE